MRDATFSVLKALAIILVVLSHAGAPGWLSDFVFIFHVPAFFICAGYFFNTCYLDDEKTFVGKRVRRLYLPFLRWSVFFLLIHNLLFYTGILNEQYGNAQGGVLHPYTWHAFFQRLWSIVFNMSGYDEFLCGSFWFFRALFLSSLAFLLLFKLLRRNRSLTTDVQVAWSILGIVFALTMWKTLGGLHVTGVAQGGYRELMGVFFMSCGFLYRRYQERVPMNWKVAAVCVLLLVSACVFFPSSMSWQADVVHFLSLPLPALAGFYLLLYVSKKLVCAGGVLKRGLIYIGEHTLYVFAFHLVAFKLVSAVKVAYCGLPWQQVGCHPVIHEKTSSFDFFFLLYLLVGVSVPLLWNAAYRRLCARYDLSLGTIMLFVARIGGRVALFSVACMRMLGVKMWEGAKSFIQGIKAILNASNPNDE
ncbi:MAG TPA: acyltransferase family protein [Alloprevotella sp.]|nr:acyltransferase family protein [Alloprevotella sp.]